jgi:hypothetical protein
MDNITFTTAQPPEPTALALILPDLRFSAFPASEAAIEYDASETYTGIGGSWKRL